MASIPTYLYFGDVAILGGAQPVTTGQPSLWAAYLNNYKFSRVVPSGQNGITGGTFEPYWDGTTNGGAGGFKPYELSGLPVGSNGDNWFLTPTNGGAVTPCTMLMNALWERHPAGFKMLKFATPTSGWGTGSAPWKAGGAGYLAAKTHWDNMVAAMATAGDTPDLRACIADASMMDILNANPTYGTDLQSFITAFRADYSSTALIVLVNHRQDFYLPGGSATRTARYLNQQVANTNANVAVFDMSWANWGRDGVVGGTELGPNQTIYETHDYLQAGVRLGRFIETYFTDPPVANAGSGIATYVLFGDSNMMSAYMDPAAVVLSKQGTLLGNVGGTERVGQYIWDAQNEQVVLYDVLGVTNSLGSTENYYGPECTFLKDAHRRTPGGVVVFKYAQAGAALWLDPEGTAFQLIRDSWAAFCLAVQRDLGRTVDCRGVGIMMGRNDGLTADGAAAFATLAAPFVDTCREAFTTRADGPELAVTWIQPSPHADSGAVFGSIVGEAAALASVRATVASLPSIRPRLSVILDPGGTYELQRDDLLHYGSEAVFQLGYDLAEHLYGLNSDEGGDDATATAESPSETAAFTVEDGTGLADANSYCSLAFADSYHDAQGNPSAWLSAAPVTKRDALRRAAESLDLRYGHRWTGIRQSSEQGLDWPRLMVTDSAGNDVEDDVVPNRVKQAAAVAALQLLQGDELVPVSLTTADISSESKTLPGGIGKSVTYMGGKSATPVFRKLDRMLETAGFISTASGWGYSQA